MKSKLKYCENLTLASDLEQCTSHGLRETFKGLCVFGSLANQSVCIVLKMQNRLNTGKK